MTADTFFGWFFLAAGVMNLGIGGASWRVGGKPQVVLSTMMIAQSATMLGPAWLHYVGWTVLAPLFVILGKRFFTERDPGSLAVGLVALPFMLFIAVTELLVDELNGWQTALFATVAVLVSAAIATAIVRLAQASRARRAARQTAY